jgi:hypothetical protein
MSTKQKASVVDRGFAVDGFGVITWGDGKDPFKKSIEVIDSVPPNPAKSEFDEVRDAAILVHANLEIARSIAVSLFGTEWRDFVMDIYDRLQSTLEDEIEDEPGSDVKT